MFRGILFALMIAFLTSTSTSTTASAVEANPEVELPAWQTYLSYSIEELESRAAAGDPIAQYVLARGHEGSIEFEMLEKDDSKIEPLFRQAAVQGYEPAQYALGMRLLTRCTETASEAVKWLEKSALSGNEYALIELGNLFFEGACVTRDLPRACAWASLATEFGIEAGQQNLRVYEEDMDNASLARAEKIAAELRTRMVP